MLYRRIINLLFFSLLPEIGWATGLEVFASIPDQVVAANSPSIMFDLTTVFGLADGVQDNIVQFDSNQGKINIELFSAAAPVTVSNFMNYVNGGDYENHIVHRSDPGFVIQGGLVEVSGTDTNFMLTPVPTDPPITNEFNQSNLRGTLAMARVAGQTNSATSQWFINLSDNTGLDTVDGGFTVFGRAIGGSMDVVDAIADLNRCACGAPFGELPLTDFTNFPVRAENFVTVYSATNISMYPDESFTASVLTLFVSDTPSNIVSASISSNMLVVTPLSNAFGEVTITVGAMDTHGASVEESFTVNVVPSYMTWKIVTGAGDQDLDGDAWWSLAEYVHVTDPTVSNQVPMQLNHSATNIRWSVPVREGLTGVTSRVFSSSDFINWAPVTPPQTQIDSGIVHWVSFAFPRTGSTSVFYRLEYELLP